LKLHPPQQAVRIRENTSWSCHHGVDRWSGTCACTPGNEDWKAQLRQAFDRLAGELDRLYLDVVKPVIPDPWKLRDQYIQVILGQRTFNDLLAYMTVNTLTSAHIQRIHLMLEAQRERQRMFTSCGWFFEDFDRIEPKNNVAYAAQAVRLARQATGIDLEPSVVKDLSRVSSLRTGRRADKIFQYHLRRAEGFKNAGIGYAD
jgi:hypothetical protein